MNYRNLQQSAINPYTVLLSITCVYVSTSIFYVFTSGLPQPADIIMAFGIMAGLFFAITVQKLKVNHLFLPLFFFAILTVLINLVHYLFLPDLRFILASFYYVYNIGIFLIIAFLFNKKPFQSRDAILIFLYVAIAIEFLVIIFAPEVRAGREIGTFNNPNQLSAWSLMSICIIIALRYHDQLRFIDLIFIVLLCLMQLSTLSKAGIISTALLIAPLSLSKIIPFNYKILSIFLIFIGLFYMVISNNYIFKK